MSFESDTKSHQTALKGVDCIAIGDVSQRLARDGLNHSEHVLQAVSDLTIHDDLLLLGAEPRDPSLEPVRRAPQYRDFFCWPRSGVRRMDKEDGDGLASISHWHVDQRPNADTHCALEIMERAVVG